MGFPSPLSNGQSDEKKRRVIVIDSVSTAISLAVLIVSTNLYHTVYLKNVNQFIIITVPNKVDRLSRHIEERLNQAMTYFYPIHDREAGYVRREGEDDPVEKVPVPFMGVTVSVLSQKDDTFTDVEALRLALSQPIKV